MPASAIFLRTGANVATDEAMRQSCKALIARRAPPVLRGERRVRRPRLRRDVLPALVNPLLNARAAAIGQPAFVTSTFAELTGAPPRTFLEWAADHAAEFRA